MIPWVSFKHKSRKVEKKIWNRVGTIMGTQFLGVEVALPGIDRCAVALWMASQATPHETQIYEKTMLGIYIALRGTLVSHFLFILSPSYIKYGTATLVGCAHGFALSVSPPTAQDCSCFDLNITDPAKHWHTNTSWPLSPVAFIFYPTSPATSENGVLTIQVMTTPVSVIVSWDRGIRLLAMHTEVIWLPNSVTFKNLKIVKILPYCMYI